MSKSPSCSCLYFFSRFVGANASKTCLTRRCGTSASRQIQGLGLRRSSSPAPFNFRLAMAFLPNTMFQQEIAIASQYFNLLASPSPRLRRMRPGELRPMYPETGDDVPWQGGSSNYRLQHRSGSRHILVGCLSFTRLCHDLDKARDSSSQGLAAPQSELGDSVFLDRLLASIIRQCRGRAGTAEGGGLRHPATLQVAAKASRVGRYLFVDASLTAVQLGRGLPHCRTMQILRRSDSE